MVDVNTTVFNKQLEELESLADATGLYDDQQEDDEEEVQAEPSMEWRRALIEESYSRVKRAKSRPVDPNRTYEIGTLLFEPAEGKFGRVKRSVPGYLCIAFLRGGEREYGRRPDVEAYLRDHHRGKTAAELAVQLGLTESEVQGHLNRLGLVRHDAIPQMDGAEPHAEDKKDKPAAPRASRKPKDLIPGMTEDDPGDDARKARRSAAAAPAEDLPPLPPSKGKADSKAASASTKAPASGKTAAPAPAASKTAAPPAKGQTKAPPAAAAATTKAPPAKGKSTAPPPAPAAKGKTTPPVAAAADNRSKLPGKPGAAMTAEEANAYIKKHFQSMSNKVLADKTGLSEHTIRRKLGEWKLRRDKE